MLGGSQTPGEVWGHGLADEMLATQAWGPEFGSPDPRESLEEALCFWGVSQC